MPRLKTHQRWARVLGVTGIVPMLVATAVLPHPLAVDFLRFYGLAIVAFVCGNAWTVALMGREVSVGVRSAVLIVSNAVVLLAVAASVWSAATTAFAVLALAFAALLMLDLNIPAFPPQPRYYRQMRVLVSTAVVLTYIFAAVRLYE